MWIRVHYSVLLAIVSVAAFSAGCDQKKLTTPTGPSAPPNIPAAPLPPVPPAGSAVTVTNISPQLGSILGATPVLINGSGFEPGATVTLDGTATDVTVLGTTVLTATTPAHGAGIVDVVVTNPGGQSGKLTGGYTYALITPGTRPLIAAITPNTGTVWGGSFLTITGTGFEPGAIVRLGITALRTYPFGSNSTTLRAQASPQSPDRVDVVVVNPDGQSATLTRGYTYAALGSLDFGGVWKGSADDRQDNHGATEIALTIHQNMVASISCNGETRLLSPPARIVDDTFSVSLEDGVAMSGTFHSVTEVRGRIEFGRCGFSWGATKE